MQNSSHIINDSSLAEFLGCRIDDIKTLVLPKKYEEPMAESGYDLIQVKAIILGENPILKHKIKKKKGEVRIVYEIRNKVLDQACKSIQAYLNCLYAPHSAVHGFVTKKSIKTNAKEHLGKKTILKLDLENFFENIKEDRVKGVFIKIGFNEEVSSSLAKIVCVEGFLPQGFCTSPVISNILFNETDELLNKFCLKNKYIYTRYADDVTISSDEFIENEEEIVSLIESMDFKINRTKTEKMFRGEKQRVTGLTVFDETEPRIIKHIKRRVRLEAYYINKFGWQKHLSRKYETTDKIIINTFFLHEFYKMAGWIFYCHSIEPTFAIKIFKKVFGESAQFSDFHELCQASFNANHNYLFDSRKGYNQVT